MFRKYIWTRWIGFGKYLTKFWMFYELFEYAVSVFREYGKSCECFVKYLTMLQMFWEIFHYAGKVLWNIWIGSESFGKYLHTLSMFWEIFEYAANVLINIWICCKCFGKGQEVLSYPAVSRLSNWSNIVHAQLYNILVQCIHQYFEQYLSILSSSPIF